MEKKKKMICSVEFDGECTLVDEGLVAKVNYP